MKVHENEEGLELNRTHISSQSMLKILIFCIKTHTSSREIQALLEASRRLV
jgi:hypothetical protein